MSFLSEIIWKEASRCCWFTEKNTSNGGVSLMQSLSRLNFSSYTTSPLSIPRLFVFLSEVYEQEGTKKERRITLPPYSLAVPLKMKKLPTIVRKVTELQILDIKVN